MIEVATKIKERIFFVNSLKRSNDAAREIQTERYKNTEGMYCNAQMSSKQLREICVINQAGETLIKTRYGKR